ncbi:MAG: hypothetical protein GC160_26250 [Acidobacteria bacterium]|nr:hypothetical protein [Acidobacteriota bacterium]
MTRRTSFETASLWLAAAALATAGAARGADTCQGTHSLRALAGPPEWSDSSPEASPSLLCRLDAGPSQGPAVLRLRQNDVKRPDWGVFLNGSSLGALPADEHLQVQAFEVPAGLLRPSGNELRIAPLRQGGGPDDIRVDDVELLPGPLAQWLDAGRIRVRVVDERGQALPARITLTHHDALLPVGTPAGADLAVRTGVVYTASGTAEFTAPAGDLVVWASRGFEYGYARRALRVERGSRHDLELRLEREVRIPGWAAGDTHLHTLEFSGHGDATAAERSVTVAGEGLAWAVSTEHNRLETIHDRGGAFVSIRGVEFTTRHGHFNLFPWPAGLALPSPSLPWEELWRALPGGNAVVAVWNHPRDTHGGYRPFDPSHYDELTARSLDGRVFPGDALEAVNSGAMYSEPLRLVADWMRHLNRGARLNAVGSSDSHTVTTTLVGQARTYVHVGDEALTPQSVAAAFSRGETAVSYGLAAFLERRGDRLVARVYGPSWNRARRLVVFSNGETIAEIAIDGPAAGGLQWEGEIEPPRLRHDAWLAVAALGDDPAVPFWPLNRPYQPVTPQWTPATLGISPALAWDGDGDGRFETAKELAEGLLRGAAEPAAVAEALRSFDAAVAAQAAALLAEQGRLEAVLSASDALGPHPTAQVLRTFRDQAAKRQRPAR